VGINDVTREAVLAAISEYEQLGQDAYLARHGFKRARKFVLFHDDRVFDSKAIIGGAHRYATGAPLAAAEFSGGERTVVARLSALGFDVRDTSAVIRSDPDWYIGEVPGVRVGDTFVDREEVRARKVHRAGQAGIVGTGERGAESIVVSGGYEDDEDYGSVIVYTGHGGRDNNTGRQVADQTFDTPGNAALLTSKLTGAPVRVVRGAHRGSPTAPSTGLRYDGLYRVVDAWQERGRSGFLMCRYRMIELHNTTAVDPVTTAPDAVAGAGESGTLHAPPGTDTPDRKVSSSARLVRRVQVVEYVKRLHDHTCQTCGTRLALGPDRGYAEGAHIRGLGRPHDGPDIPANVLCLCPNCHVLFDNGALHIAPDLSITINCSPAGKLRTHPSHAVDPGHLDYHRSVHG
jgi:predicted restriction endonuclease